MGCSSDKNSEYERDQDGRMKLIEHSTPCLLCDRINELGNNFVVKFPSVLEHDTDTATWIHRNYDEAIRSPLWLHLTSETFRDQRNDSVTLYNQVHSSMLQDFPNQELTEVCCGSTRDDYVISYSLYRDKLRQFPFYWLGLKLNIDAVKQWFKGWTIHLYVEKSLTDRPFFDWIIKYAKDSQVPLRVIHCNEGAHPMLERYRPLTELASGVCIVRDIDSILSLTDAKIVDCWLRDPAHDVLIYSEYKMSWLSAGGGVALKIDKRLGCGPEMVMETVIGPTRGRGLDERRLHYWLKKATDTKRHAIVDVRMNELGIYCLDFYHGNPKVLWSNSYQECPALRGKGYYNKIASLEECEKECERLVTETSSHQHVHSHKEEHRSSMLQGIKWAR